MLGTGRAHRAATRAQSVDDLPGAARHAKEMLPAQKVADGARGAGERPSGSVLCWWALLTPTPAAPDAKAHANDFSFLYVDPVAQACLGEHAPQLRGRSMLSLAHRDDRAQVHADIQRIVQSRTLFGSVTRCRFTRATDLWRVLDGSAEDDSGYTLMDVVVNWVEDGMALAFFHSIDDGDSGGVPRSCGTPPGAFDARQCALLRETAEQTLGTASGDHLHYVFQVLAYEREPRVLFSWPPTRDTAGQDGDALTTYVPSEFARLANGIENESGPSDALTSCTRRFRATHTLVASGRTREIASVLIPYGSIVLACFQITCEAPLDAPHSQRESSAKRAREPSAGASPVARQSPLHAGGALGDGSWKAESHIATPLHSHAARSALDTNVATLAAVAAAAAAKNKTCSSCGQSNSPEWRRGPSGHKTLCNACGLRYARSLSNKRKKGKDGQLVMLQPTGDPDTVPPSRGSGGGSRAGVHRRAGLKRGGIGDDADGLLARDDTPTTDTHAASVPLAPVPGVPLSLQRPIGAPSAADTSVAPPPARDGAAGRAADATPHVPTLPSLPDSVVEAAAAAAAADPRFNMHLNGSTPAPFVPDATTASTATEAAASAARDPRAKDANDVKSLYNALFAQNMPQDAKDTALTQLGTPTTTPQTVLPHGDIGSMSNLSAADAPQKLPLAMGGVESHVAEAMASLISAQSPAGAPAMAAQPHGR